jgi:uncharacterized protein (TIGR00255 family)
MSHHPCSMTGFGRAVVREGDRRLVVEARSLNHRGIDVKVRARELDAPPPIETEIVRVVRSTVARGSVVISIRDESRSDGPALDAARVRAAHAALESLRADLGLPGPVDLGTVAAFLSGPAMAAGVGAGELTWDVLRPGVEEALREMQLMRAREGAALVADLRQRLDRLRGLAARIGELARGLPTRAARRLEERLASLTTGTPGLDTGRLAQEVALLAEKVDVSEELVRLATHLDHLEHLLDGKDGQPPGRKIDFLVQEIGRELNTIGSKVQDAPIAALVVEGKAELEKLREQAQNIE